jgi:outer membrane protein
MNVLIMKKLMKKYMNPFSINRICRLFILTLILLFQGVFHDARAQQRLSLQDALVTGLKNHYGVRIARGEKAVADRNASIGNAGMLPAVSASASYDKSSLDAEVSTVTGAGLEKNSAPVTVTTAVVQAQWTLFDGTAMFIEYEKLKNLAARSKLELNMMMEDAVFSITAAYLDIILQQQLLASCKKQLEISNMRLNIASLKYESGSGSEQEMIQAQVIRQADTAAFTRQWSSLKKSRINLNQLIAVELEADFITDDSISLLTTSPLDEYIKAAVITNNAYLLAEEQLRYSGLDIKSLRAKQYPRLVLKGSYGYYENETEASFIKYSKTLGPQLGVSAWINIFDGMNQRRKIANARIEQDIEQIRYKESEQAVIASVMNCWYDHYSLMQAVTLGKEGLALAEKNISIATEAYSSGLISSLQLREAQDDLFKASSDLCDALYQARMKESELLLLCGRLVKGEE